MTDNETLIAGRIGGVSAAAGVRIKVIAAFLIHVGLIVDPSGTEHIGRFTGPPINRTSETAYYL